MGVPLAALQIQGPAMPRSPLETYGRAMEVQDLVTRNRVNQLALEKQQQDMEDREIIRNAFTEADGDPTETLTIARRNGASPDMILRFQESYATQREKMAKLSEQEFKNFQTQNDLAARALQAVESADPDLRPVVYAQQMESLKGAGVDVSTLPAEYPGDDAMRRFKPMIGLNANILKEAQEDRRVTAAEEQAKIARERLEVEKPGIEAKGRISQQEADMDPEYRQLIDATEVKLAAMAATGNVDAKKAMNILQKYKAAVAASEAAAKARAEFEAFGGFGGGVSVGVPTQDGLNEAILAGLPAGIAGQVKALSEGRMQFPGSFALRSPYWQRMLMLVSQYDPSFDTTQWPVRVKVRQDFTVGNAGRNIRSLNTAIGHLQSLREAADDLDNIPVKVWNTIANWGITQAGDPRTVRFNTAKNAVAGEAATIFKNTSGTDQEIRTWSEQIDSSQSPEQLNAAVTKITELLASRMDALEGQWRVGMQRARDFRLLNERSVQILMNIPGGPEVIERERQGREQIGAGVGIGAVEPPAVPRTLPPTPVQEDRDPLSIY